MTFGAKGPMQMTFTNVCGLGSAIKDLWIFSAKSQGTEDGSTEALLQILYGPNLILEVFGSYMF